MNKASKITLLAVSALLILGGIAAAVFAIATESKRDTAPSGDSIQTTVPHDSVEIDYNDDGNIKSERYYDNNVYVGKRDYHYSDTAMYTMDFDRDGKEVASSVTEFNIVGSISKVTSYKFHLLSEETEYDYYDDLRTPEKKTVKTYVGNDIYAEKTYFSADGKKTRHCKFLNGEIIEDTYYDENGNVIKDGGETIED